MHLFKAIGELDRSLRYFVVCFILIEFVCLSKVCSCLFGVLLSYIILATGCQYENHKNNQSPNLVPTSTQILFIYSKIKGMFANVQKSIGFRATCHLSFETRYTNLFLDSVLCFYFDCRLDQVLSILIMILSLFGSTIRSLKIFMFFK